MITIQNPLTFTSSYPPKRLGAISDLLFFDIETTGFSGDYASVYLIGCVWHDGNTWILTQYFAETRDAEEEVLDAFFALLRTKRILVHFNGDGFDIPFLTKRCVFYKKDWNFEAVESFDIYKKIRPLKKLLGLENLKQKSIERFLGIAREDKYNGGQLIEVYGEYLQTHSELLKHLLILHNEDDLKGMPQILPILAYPDFLTGDFSFKGSESRDIPYADGNAEKHLLLHYDSPVSLTSGFQFSIGELELSAEGNRLTLDLPLYSGELKRFYSDYENYYYMLYEDCAIHKSVGQYVDRSARKKATAKTCYTRAAGLFVPQPLLADGTPMWHECLKADYKSKQLFVPYSEQLFTDPETAVLYLHNYLRELSL